MFYLQVEQLTEEQKNGRCVFNLMWQPKDKLPGLLIHQDHILGSFCVPQGRAPHPGAVSWHETHTAPSSSLPRVQGCF